MLIDYKTALIIFACVCLLGVGILIGQCGARSQDTFDCQCIKCTPSEKQHD